MVFNHLVTGDEHLGRASGELVQLPEVEGTAPAERAEESNDEWKTGEGQLYNTGVGIC